MFVGTGRTPADSIALSETALGARGLFGLGFSAGVWPASQGHGLPATVPTSIFLPNTVAANLFIPIGVFFATQTLGTALDPFKVG